jgi:hypothetical protein
VNLGYFPAALSRRVVYEKFGPILKAYEELLSMKILDTLIPAPVRSVFVSEFGGGIQLFGERPGYQFSSTEKVIRPISFFQNALILANGFAKNERLRGLVNALSFAGDTIWQKAMASDKLIPELADSRQAVDFPSHEKWAVYGFCEFLRFMQAFRQIRNDVQDKSIPFGPGEFDFLVTLDQQVREIQQWRLNFGYPGPRERFLEVANSSLEMVLASKPNEEGRESARARLKKETLELMRDWGAQLSMEADAT